MKLLKVLIVFLFLNFGALLLGGLFTSSGVTSEWYTNINQAPWTPPGWLFGVAWTSIMICFSFYMTNLYCSSSNRKNVILLFALQWSRVSWNPIFFHFQLTGLALIVISSLTLIVASFFIFYSKQNRFNRVLLSPYLIWLTIATSLNFYIFQYN